MEQNSFEIYEQKSLKELLGAEKWLELNAKLSQKKNKARKKLTEMGVLEKKGKNTYDNYKYFTEAQYKDVANKLLSDVGLELSSSEKEYYKYDMTGSKTPVGRIVTMVFTLTDTETGFYEESVVKGEGLDRGDKAGYKAYTGAVKYYLANTFLIPTGDDAEKESPVANEDKQIKKDTKVILIQPSQIEILKKYYVGENMNKLLIANKLSRIEDMTMVKASELIKKIQETAKKEEEK